jgi:N-acetylglucosamine-6-phosphate deacetylase
VSRPINATRRVIHSGRLISAGVQTNDAWVAFTGNVISAVGTGDNWRGLGVATECITDAAGRWMTAGFIDLHCHGGGGTNFEDSDEGTSAALAVHHQHGATRLVLSLVSAAMSDLEERLARVAILAEANPLVLGAHLEGPFLAHDFRGAHDEGALRHADGASVARLIEIGRGHICQVTLAPELPGAQAAMAAFLAHGIVVAVGHTAADYDSALAAFDAGATILTHAFNRMKGIDHRAPGPVVAAMRSPEVILELINDGIHVHPDVVRLAFAGAPGRIALITDAMAATGQPDGHYTLGTVGVIVENGVARTESDGAIAGSTLTLDVALRNAVTVVGISLADAVTSVTTTPAAALGRGHDLGAVAPGYVADLVLLSADLRVEAVFADGVQIFAG